MADNRVTGAFTATGQSASFRSDFPTTEFNASLWGTFAGSVQLERTFDGINWLPITAAGLQLGIWTAPCSEAFADSENGVLYRLNCTSFASGTINYRISQ